MEKKSRQTSGQTPTPNCTGLQPLCCEYSQAYPSLNANVKGARELYPQRPYSKSTEKKNVWKGKTPEHMLGFSSEMWLSLTLVLKGLHNLLLSVRLTVPERGSMWGRRESRTKFKFLFRVSSSDSAKCFCWSQKGKWHHFSDTFSISFMQMTGMFILGSLIKEEVLRDALQNLSWTLRGALSGT